MKTRTLLLAALVATLLPLSATASADDNENARRTLLLRVQYVGSDYRRAVPEAGRVGSDAELAENLAFAREAAASYRRMKPDGAHAAELDRLASTVEAKAAPADVETLVAALIAPLRRELELAPAPMFFPDLAVGRAAYARLCASCHGSGGLGDGPNGLKLDPPPRSLADADWADGQSPLQVFNTITVGIAGTAMLPFGSEPGATPDASASRNPPLDASTRWALAFAVLTLKPPLPLPASPPAAVAAPTAMAPSAAQPATATIAAKPGPPRPWIGVTELSLSSNRELTAMLLQRGIPAEAAAAYADAARRAEPPVLTVAAAMTRLRAAAVTAAALSVQGRKAEAGDTLDATYFDAVEPVEPELLAKAPPHLEALETAVAALREAIRSSTGVAPARDALEAELDAIALAGT